MGVGKSKGIDMHGSEVINFVVIVAWSVEDRNSWKNEDDIEGVDFVFIEMLVFVMSVGPCLVLQPVGPLGHGK